MPMKEVRLVKQREACERLGISADTFARHWSQVFTDKRPLGPGRHGRPRQVFSDELDLAVEYGGEQDRERAAAAVLDLRKTKKRV